MSDKHPEALEAARKAYAAAFPDAAYITFEGMEAAITAYLAALPAGDEAGLVKDLRFLSGEAAKNVMASDVFAKSLGIAADEIERQSATIARLRGEVDYLKDACERQSKAADDWAEKRGAEKARADKAEAALARLMEQPTENPLRMTPEQRKELWAAHDQARAALHPQPDTTERRSNLT